LDGSNEKQDGGRGGRGEGIETCGHVDLQIECKLRAAAAGPMAGNGVV
jgi:hypothetical protein